MPVFPQGTGPAWRVLNDTGLRKHEFDGSRAPGVMDDLNANFERGSQWFWGDRWWFCFSNAPGAAIWFPFRPEPIQNVPVTVEAIHAALVALGLITGPDPSATLIAVDASGLSVVFIDGSGNPINITEA